MIYKSPGANVETQTLKLKLSQSPGSSPIEPKPTGSGKFTVAPEPKLNSILLRLWPLSIARNSKKVRRRNIYFKHGICFIS